MAALGHDLARGVEHDDLHVGLADVENRDAAVHASVQMERLDERRGALAWNRHREEPGASKDARLSTGMATRRSRSRRAPYVPLDCFAIARPEGRASFDAL